MLYVRGVSRVYYRFLERAGLNYPVLLTVTIVKLWHAVGGLYM
jgi:hypothetical protein